MNVVMSHGGPDLIIFSKIILLRNFTDSTTRGREEKWIHTKKPNKETQLLFEQSMHGSPKGTGVKREFLEILCSAH